MLKRLRRVACWIWVYWNEKLTKRVETDEYMK
jgi:hypothetical protein